MPRLVSVLTHKFQGQTLLSRRTSPVTQALLFFRSKSYFSSLRDIVNSQSGVNQSVSLSVRCLRCRKPPGHEAEVINAGIYLSNWSPTRRKGLWRQLSWGWRDSSTPVFRPSLLLFNEEEWRIAAGFPSGHTLHDSRCCSSYLWWYCGFQWKMVHCFKNLWWHN